MNSIKLLDGNVYDIKDLELKARNDDFYYNDLGNLCFSSSICGYMLSSPKSYYYLKKYGNEESTTSLSIGGLVHVKTLEPERFDDIYDIADVASKNTKAYKELKLSSSKKVITKLENEQANRIAEALLKNDAFINRLQGASTEVPKVGEILGLPFRGKADILNAPFLYDLKTTTDISSFKFSAQKYNYDLQAFIYCELFGIDFKDFEFVVVDKKSLDIGIFSISEDFYNSGFQKLIYCSKLYQDYFLDKSEEEIIDGINNYYIKAKL